MDLTFSIALMKMIREKNTREISDFSIFPSKAGVRSGLNRK